MEFESLEPFVPSGSKYEESKQFFLALGFKITWDAGDYAGFEKDGCRFILQHFENREFAENFMVSVRVKNVVEFYNFVVEAKLPERFGIRVSEPADQPYGKEVNIIDIAGVCWHFVE